MSPPPSHTIRAVLFDYGMVLSGPPVPAAKARMRQILNNADTASFERAYWLRRDDYDRGHLDGQAYWATVADELGEPLSAEQVAQLIAADTDLWAAPNQDMIAWAFDLQRRGIRTGILSNIGDAMEAGITARFAWIGDFHHRTFSHRLRLAKPDPAIYDHAVEGLGVPAAAILFIDDRAENIVAAERAGMQAIRYTTHGDFVEAMRERGFDDLLEQST